MSGRKFNINIKEFLTKMAFFLLLLYPFNTSLIQYVYFNNIIFLITTLIFGLLLLILFTPKRRLSKSVFTNLIAFLIVMTIFLLFRNSYLKSGDYFKFTIFIIYFLCMIILLFCDRWFESFYKVLKLFLYEHVFATLLFPFIGGFYKSTILPMVCSNSLVCTAKGNFYNGYMPGLTSHFSTNGMYISIAILYFFNNWLNNKNKKNLILFILSVIAMLLVGKRGPLLFCALACLFMYMFSENRKNRFLTVITIILSMIFLITILGNYIPSIYNIINRFESLIAKGDILNGRSTLFDLAIDMWKKDIFIGQGWGAYRYNYQVIIYSYGAHSFLDAHNIYLQLLAELGIIGFAFFVLSWIKIMLSSLKSFKLIRKEKLLDYKKQITFSILVQIFFLMYGFTGNPLYDVQVYAVYFICIAVSLVTTFSINRGEVYENRNNYLS